MSDAVAPDSSGGAVPLTSAHDRRADLVFALAIGCALAGLALLYLAFPTLVATFTIASVLAYALIPVIDRLAARMPRLLAGLMVALAAIAMLAGLVVAVGPSLITEMRLLPGELERTGRELQAYWIVLHGRLPGRLVTVLDAGVRAVSDAARDVAPTGARLSAWASQAAAALTAVATGLIFVPIFVVLMLRGYHPFVRALEELVPARWRPRFAARFAELDRVLSGFVRGQLLVAAILVVLYSVAFSLVGIPLALLVGLLAGLGELVPFVGGLVAASVGSLLAVAGGEPWDVLWVLLVCVVIQTLQGTVISPWIVGGKVRLSPVTVVVALAIGGRLFGLFGMLASVPAAAVLKVAIRAALEAYAASGFYRRTRPA